MSHNENILTAKKERDGQETEQPIFVSENTQACATMTAMSFNVWVAHVTDARAAHVVERIKEVMPDTLGVQEASTNWVNRLTQALSDDYGYVGEGREPDGGGEHSGIFYKKDTLKVIESGTKWMSDTPDVPSKYEASTCYRVFSYAVLERVCDASRFVHVNVHTEHTSYEICRKQLVVLMNFINARFSEIPVILTGDFNAPESSAPLQHVLSNGMVNAASIAKKTDPSPTFTPGGSIIDFCLVSEGDFTVCEYAVDSYKYGDDIRDPSDHCPVYIRYAWKA